MVYIFIRYHNVRCIRKLDVQWKILFNSGGSQVKVSTPWPRETCFAVKENEHSEDDVHEVVSFSICYSMLSLSLKDLEMFFDIRKHVFNKDSLNSHFEINDLFNTVGVSVSVDNGLSKLIDGIAVYCGVYKSVPHRLQDILEIII